MNITQMKHFFEEISGEARNILRFWSERMPDPEQGGFYGRIDGRGQLHPQADKGVILNTRILWTFSAAARHFGDSGYALLADRAYQYLQENFVDRRFGGVYWMLDYQGQPLATKKQIYAQAFAIYALTEYARLSGEKEALSLAVDLYHLVEEYSYDEVRDGYFEAYSREWRLLDDLRLSDRDANEKKTMNTHLHLLEAYTNLYRIWPDIGLREQLVGLIRLFLQRFIGEETGHLQLFFDENWAPKSDAISFGHDIETSWLLTEAAEVLADANILEEVQKTALRLADITLAEGIDYDGAVFNECGPQGLIDANKDWWPQAEAMVGFFNAYQLSGNSRYLEAAQQSWHFIQHYLIDPENGEWHWGLSRERQVRYEEDKAGPWKAPYHNTRACLELLVRIGEKGG